MKKHLSKRLTALLLALVMSLGLALPAGAVGTSGKTGLRFEKVDNSVVSSTLGSDRLVQETAEDTALYRDTDQVRVSIILAAESTIEKGFAVEGIASNAQAVTYRDGLQAQQEAVAAAISTQVLGGKALDVVWNLTLAANIISANVAYGDIEAIKAVKGVEDVILETRYEPMVTETSEADPNMATSSEMIGSTAAWAEGYTGKGSLIAVIDTGTDTDHQSFDADAFLHAVGEDAELMNAEDIAAVLNQLNIASLVGNAEDLYLNAKLPFAFNYVDEDLDVIHDNDSQGEHGSHVAGIATANRYIKVGEDEYEDALTAAHTQGVAPDAQLLTMKVFGKGGGAYDSDYMAAIEDAIVLGADSINLSLGSGNPGFSNHSDAKYQAILDSLTEAGAVVCMSAGNSGTWQENTLYGYLYNDGVSMQTNGSPGSYTNSLSVASADNTGSTGNFLNFGAGLEAVSFTESSGYTNEPIATLDNSGDGSGAEYDFILFDNTGVDGSGNNLLTDYTDVCAGKVVMVYRGTSSFYEKHNAADEVGGIACIVVNNQAGTINMDLSSSKATIPCVSIQQADGEAVKALETTTAVTDDDGDVLYYTGKVTISSAINSVQGSAEYITMSSFSSWGIPGSLEMKPEITAPGGNIYSVNGAVAGGQAYENMSGTSMASPQVAGMMAVVAQYIRENDLTTKTGLTQRQLAQSLLMSTAEPLVEEASDSLYSILTQGAGLANVGDAVNATSYITMAKGSSAGAADGKVKVELGDDPDQKGVYQFTYTIHNLTDAEATYTFRTEVFTQDVFGANTYSGYEVLLDTWTAPLEGAKVSYAVNGRDNEAANEAADKILAYAAGSCQLTEDELKDYDLNGDGTVNTYDAHLMLAAAVPASGSIDVTVTIDVSECDFSYYLTGAYIEAYTYATELSSEEGVEGTEHSIPVLGYYGSWTSPSMYDVGTLAEYWYETEERYPYLINYTDAITNYLTVKYPGNNGEYYYFGNPLTDDDEYLEERNAFNSNGALYKYYYTLIRNAGGAIWQVTDAESGEVYAREELGSRNSAYYYSNGSAWYNTQSSTSLNWQGTDLKGNQLPEDTEVYVSLIMAPEYYRSADGTYDWDALTDDVLGEGAYLTTRTAIDNTAPEMTELVYDAESGTLTATAGDNRYLAVVALYQNGVSKELNFVAPNQELDEKGKSGEYVLDVSGLEAGAELYIQLTDYAMNQSTYKFVLTEDGMDQNEVNPTSVSLSDITVVKGTTGKLTPSFEPFLAKEEVIWESNDESIATVDENGYVTGVEEGETTITVTSVYDDNITDTCTVTVKAYKVTLTGALQDVDGNPQLFTWDLENDSTWSKTVDIDNNINSLTYGSNVELVEVDGEYAVEFKDDVMYQMDTSGYLYKVDVESGETLETSATTVAFGAPVDDMEYAYISSQLFGQNILFGVYGGYFLYSTPAEGNSFNYGWNFSSYLAYYTGASNFTTIAWAGYTKDSSDSYVDVFYCLDDAGYVWKVAPNLQTGSAGLSIRSTDLDLSFPGYGGTYYCSMVLGDDGDFYLSYFDGSTNQIYVLEEEAVYEDGEFAGYTLKSTFLGDVGDAVWPAGLLTVTSNEKAGSEEGGEDDGEFLVMPEDMIEVKAEAISLPEPETTGGLNAVKVTESAKAQQLTKLPAAESNGVTVTDKGYVYLDVSAADSTNGLVDVAYDTDVLTLEDIDLGHEHLAFNCQEGQVTLAYAAAGKLNQTVATLIFSYDKNSCPNKTFVTVTTHEDGTALPESTKQVTVTLKNVVVVEPSTPGTGDEDGSSSSGSTGGETGETGESGLPFTDVDENSGFYADIVYAYENGLMNGTTTTTFSPDDNTSRGMIAAILYRLAGSPAVSGENPFSDVADGSYCDEATIWAQANGVVNGYSDGTYRPDEAITREQMVAILYRYAKLQGVDVSVGEDTNILSYSDFDQVDEYAIPAFQWACGAGIINGTTTSTLSPKGNATRGQVSAILHRFAESI